MKHQPHGFCFGCGAVFLEIRTVWSCLRFRLRQGRPRNSRTFRFLANRRGTSEDLRNRGHLNRCNDHFAGLLLEPSVGPRGRGLGGLGAAADSRQGAEQEAEWRYTQESA